MLFTSKTSYQTIQVPIDNFDVAPIELGTPSENLLYTNSDIVFEKSLLNRPEIESAKLAIESADLSIEIAKSAYKPTLTYSLSAGTSYYHQFNKSKHASGTIVTVGISSLTVAPDRSVTNPSAPLRHALSLF